MKKILLTIVIAATTAGAAFAQGLVTFTTTAAAITAQTNATVYSPLFGGGAANGTQGGTASATVSPTGSYDYALLYESFSGSQATDLTLADLITDWTFSGFTATNSSTIDRLIANNVPATVPWASGVTDSIVLVGWSANLGTTWNGITNLLASIAANPSANTAVGDAFFGVSTTGYINPSTSLPSPQVFAGGADAAGLPINSLLTQLYLLPTPEPGTMALTGLGALSMLLFRRRK
jgi:hypothetical protein